MAIKRLSSDERGDGTLVNLGNVGIGTSSPGRLLQVAASASTSGIIRITSNAQAANGIEIGHGYGSGTDNIAWILNRANADFVLGTNNAENIRITAAGNVGIGTTSPLSTLHLAKSGGAVLRVTTDTGAGGGDSSILMGNQDSVGANKPYILRSFNAALYIGTGDSWSSATGGTLTTRMTIDSSGNVGIGKSAYGSLTTNGVWLQPNDYAHVSATTSNGVLYINQNGAGPIVSFLKAGVEKFQIDTNGRVGIGNSGPETELHVKGTGQWVQPIIDSTLSSTGGSSIVLRGNQNSWVMSSRSSANGTTNNGFSIYEDLSASIRFVIKTGGNVGIGTSDPVSTLHVVAPNTYDIEARFTGGNTQGLAIQNATMWEYRVAADTGEVAFNYTGYNSGTTYYRNTTVYNGKYGQIAFFQGSTSRLGLGTSSPAEKLHVAGNVLLDNNNGFYVKNNAGTSCRIGAVDSVNQLLFGDGLTTSMYFTAGSHVYFNVGGAYRGNIDSTNGRWRIGDSTGASYQLHLTTDSAAKPTSNTWTISSDARVKEVIGSYTRGVADIMALEPKRYRLNGAFGSVDDGRVHVSVVAQEAQATWPEMVGTYEHTDKDEDDVETVTELLNLNTNELQWALVNAIKELTTRIATLEQRA